MLLCAASLIGAATAVVGVPLLHVALRRPPLLGGGVLAEGLALVSAIVSSLLEQAAPPRSGFTPPKAERGGMGARVPSYGTSGDVRGCLDSWSDAGTLPAGASV